MEADRARRSPLRRVQRAKRRATALGRVRSAAQNGLRVGDRRAVRGDPLAVLRRKTPSARRNEAMKKSISVADKATTFHHRNLMSDVQTRVQEALDHLVDSGAERGIQVAVYRGPDLVVDAVAGVADPATARLVSSETPFYNFSIVKGAASTIAHILVERGAFGYDTPVADLWPEFGAHSKQAVTVRHVLNHSAGVPGIPLDTTVQDLCNWDKMCAAIADEELWWEPGTKVGYHALTFGYLVGEVVRRATDKPISAALCEYVSGPLGVADEIYFGMPESEHH